MRGSRKPSGAGGGGALSWRRAIVHPAVQALLVAWTGFAALSASDRFGPSLFAEGWPLSLTMVFGSLVAGSTSEGGGAVAFPVMTLLFGLPPGLARDFSLLVQSVGMLAAAWTIVRTRIPVETRALLWSSLGGALGVGAGLVLLSSRVSPPAVKLFFVSLWLAFGGVLWWSRRHRERAPHLRIHDPGPRAVLLLLGAGFLGGCVSGLTGSGLDIVTFSLLTLGFGVCEKVATPTSVVLMGGNALVGVLWRVSLAERVLGPVDALAWDYWYCCVPVVVVGAPLGALLVARRSRDFVVRLLLCSIVAQFVGALLIVPQTAAHWLLVLATVGLGGLFFALVARYGPSGAGSRCCEGEAGEEASPRRKGEA
ncbi:MAG: sulfite exporter TauE/SafE family protein [Planctomycetota bacterium]|nr:MAG: sulfite exporter TauE/SafE family protein [Planctomycetota bacterium]